VLRHVMTIRTVVLLLVLLAIPTAEISAASPSKVAPLGFEIGVADYNTVKRSLPRQSNPRDHGINKFSDGPMIQTGGEGYGVEGLQNVGYIFDRNNILCGVIMTFSKYRFDDVYSHLAEKYRLENRQIPFVGDKFARFRSGKAIVELSAPHLGFEMYANYLTDDLVRRRKSIDEAEEEEKIRSERGKF